MPARRLWWHLSHASILSYSLPSKTIMSPSLEGLMYGGQLPGVGGPELPPMLSSALPLPAGSLGRFLSISEFFIYNKAMIKRVSTVKVVWSRAF